MAKEIFVNKKISVIGGGIMGTVLARALAKTGSSKQILVCERNIIRHKELKKIGSCVHAVNRLADCEDSNVIFLAIKPQDFGSLEMRISKKTLVCSIMAGISISHIRKKLKTDKVIRMMPNMASRVGEGFTAWTTTAKVNILEKKWVENFLAGIGIQLYLKTEDQINKATAVTGSGPAYILNILSMFMRATEQLGFKKEEAKCMVRQVLRGANALVNEDTDFAELTHQVTSKGGTTEAALQVFTNSDMEETWVKAIDAAYKRARELSKQSLTDILTK